MDHFNLLLLQHDIESLQEAVRDCQQLLNSAKIRDFLETKTSVESLAKSTDQYDKLADASSDLYLGTIGLSTFSERIYNQLWPFCVPVDASND